MERDRAAQTPDLTPLLPVPTAGTEAVRNALLSGDAVQAAALAASLEPGSRDLWRGILAIAGNDATSAIRLLRRTDHPKALGVAYYIARQYLLFREQMAEAIRRDPSDLRALLLPRTPLRTDVDNPEQAALWFSRALERNPGYGRARAHLGDCMESLAVTSRPKPPTRLQRHSRNPSWDWPASASLPATRHPRSDSSNRLSPSNHEL